MEIVIQVIVEFEVHLVPLKVLIYIIFHKVHLTEGSKKKVIPNKGIYRRV